MSVQDTTPTEEMVNEARDAVKDAVLGVRVDYVEAVHTEQPRVVITVNKQYAPPSLTGRLADVSLLGSQHVHVGRDDDGELQLRLEYEVEP